MWNKLGLLGYPELWDKLWLGYDSTVGWNHELLCGLWIVFPPYLTPGWNHNFFVGRECKVDCVTLLFYCTLLLFSFTGYNIVTVHGIW